ncbi:hypothetical protein GCM10007209_21210 [Haloferax sulfurifontis]|uniref:Uncharacterized protein n=2 Tax=Haloferax sulfurifontis TaxID=255616 RepID=A0A830DTQ4_9EURY|nr:hypothetical protein GCM10007209_21210 [Haloferax sulfurifontis]
MRPPRTGSVARTGRRRERYPRRGRGSDMLQLGPVDGLIETFGPFAIPVLLFAAGFVGYLVLVALGRTGRDGD